MAPLPIALCGKHPSMATSFSHLMLPEYDVVHVCHTAPVAKSELPPLLAGEHTIAASEKGSNINSDSPKVPKAIFVGGGFSKSEVNEMREVAAMSKVPWLVAVPKGSVPPPMAVIASRVKEVFKEKGFVEGGALEEGGGEGEVWEFYDGAS